MSASPLAGSFHPAERIVVPVEGTDREFLAQTWAVEFAAALGIPVRGVHVRPGDEPPTPLFGHLERECEKWGVDCTTTVVEGTDTVEEIVGELAPTDLVVVGTRALKRGFHLGSVALGLVRSAPCPVQIVRIE